MRITYLLLSAAITLTACAETSTTNNYTITGNDNKFDTTQTCSTAKPTDVSTDVAGSGYGAVTKEDK